MWGGVFFLAYLIHLNYKLLSCHGWIILDIFYWPLIDKVIPSDHFLFSYIYYIYHHLHIMYPQLGKVEKESMEGIDISFQGQQVIFILGRVWGRVGEIQ